MMKKQIEYGFWIIVETNAGTECIDADVVFDQTPQEGAKLSFDEVKNYCEGDEPEGIPEVVRGYGARLSASGYLDCTEWTFFEEKQEALDFLEEMYGDNYEG